MYKETNEYTHKSSFTTHTRKMQILILCKNGTSGVPVLLDFDSHPWLQQDTAKHADDIALEDLDQDLLTVVQCC